MPTIHWQKQNTSEGPRWFTWRVAYRAQVLIWKEAGFEAYRQMQERLGEVFAEAANRPKGAVLVPADPMAR